MLLGCWTPQNLGDVLAHISSLGSITDLTLHGGYHHFQPTHIFPGVSQLIPRIDLQDLELSTQGTFNRPVRIAEPSHVERMGSQLVSLNMSLREGEIFAKVCHCVCMCVLALAL